MELDKSYRGSSSAQASAYKRKGNDDEDIFADLIDGTVISGTGKCDVKDSNAKTYSVYQGGISVMDFTDSAYPKEIAFFDRGPVDDELLVMGGYWSAYYYDGYIYGTEISRGLDVFKLSPSQFLTKKEIFEASKAQPLYGPKVFNPQQQVPLGWSRKY